MMRVPPPFRRLSKRERGRALKRLGAAQVAVLIPLLAEERRMKRTGGPGIIPFELAGPERAERIMELWGASGRAAARRSLILDYPYLATYAPLQALLCLRAGEAFRRRGRRTPAAAASPLAWGQLAAGVFDAVENAALLGVLGGGDRRLPALARRSARAKFALLYLGWGYMLVAAAVRDATR